MKIKRERRPTGGQEAVFVPGMKPAIHRYSGPEAWDVLAGPQCLETTSAITVARAGEGAIVQQGTADGAAQRWDRSAPLDAPGAS